MREEHFSKNYDYVINVNREKVYRRIPKSYICVRDLFTKRRMKGPVFKTNQFVVKPAGPTKHWSDRQGLDTLVNGI